MEKINFVNNSTPALNATNLNKLQDNVENAIAEQINTQNTTSDSETYSCNYINGIVESGSNANGSYIKFLDGTMVCYKSITGSININSSWGAIYDSGENNLNLGDWAVQFISTPKISIQFTGANGQWIEGITNLSNIHAGNIIIASATSKTANCYYDVIGIGKWK